jgi:hypothetical protein
MKLLVKLIITLKLVIKSKFLRIVCHVIFLITMMLSIVYS